MLMSLPLDLVALAVLGLAALRPIWANGPMSERWSVAVNAAVVVAATWWCVSLAAGGWQTDFGFALWATVAASAVVFLAISLASVPARRLSVLLMPYLTILAAVGSAIRGQAHPLAGGAPPAWIDVHIGLAVAVTAVLTVAAVASLAVAVQERALKAKSPMPLAGLLPSVNDSESLAGRLLAAAELLLGVGLATGMAVEYFETGRLLQFDHKTVLSLAAFVLIGALIIGHRVCGVRGRVAARVVLTAYLLLMLASPGVKFVTQVLL